MICPDLDQWAAGGAGAETSASGPHEVARIHAAPRRAAPGPIRSRGGATAGPQAQTSPQSRPQAPPPPEGGATSQKRGLRGPAPGLSSGQLPTGE